MQISMSFIGILAYYNFCEIHLHGICYCIKSGAVLNKPLTMEIVNGVAMVAKTPPGGF